MPEIKWIKEKVFEESKKYSSLLGFVKKCGPAYTAARNTVG